MFIDIVNFLIVNNFVWVIIPIFFIGIITDKYQEEFGTSIGNAISNGALVIFTGFSWFEIIGQRLTFHPDFIVSQFIFALLVITYGMIIIASGFKSGEFAQKYGRIRVVTFMLIFFTLMIYIPELYNFLSIVLFVFLFPFYYAFITEIIKIMPKAGGSLGKQKRVMTLPSDTSQSVVRKLHGKIHEYLYES